MPYIYMDLMKQAVPGNYIKDKLNMDPEIHFAVFGTYDWLHCSMEGSFPSEIGVLKDAHEKRHNVCWNYERQPLFLYFCEKNEKKVQSICDNKNSDRGSWPLVMTLLQLEKSSLCGAEIEVDDFLDAFQNKIEDVISTSDIESGDIDVCICWNLSGSDILILSRTKRLSIVSQIIGVLQKDGVNLSAEGDMNVHVFSFSSHCAFPCNTIGKSSQAEEKTTSIPIVNKDDILKWIRNEQNLKLISFVETSYNYDGVAYEKGPYHLLFGERDYRLPVKGNSREITDAIVDRLNHQTASRTGHYSFRSSYLVPGIVVNGFDTEGIQGPNEYETVEKQDDSGAGDPASWFVNTLGKDKNSELFIRIKQRLLNIQEIINREDWAFGTPDTSGLPTSQQIDHCINSLMGLLKYSMRLQATINQYDLYCYIRKLYEGLDQAVKQYEKQINKMSLKPESERNPDALRKYVWDLIMQIMSFVSELQHLFSVLALSPHNYMETYSSSMRSLNAASKLWGAYNGLIEKLADLFQTEIDGKRQQCTVMLSPYRERKSKNGQFLSAFAEEKTLVLIQMNFALMFRPKMAVYMILHECGHHFSDHCREVRFEYMSKTFLSYMLEGALRPHLTAPLYMLLLVDDKQKDKARIIENYNNYLENLNDADNNPGKYRKLLKINLFDNKTNDELKNLYDEWCDTLQQGYKFEFEHTIEGIYGEFKEQYLRKDNKELGWKWKNYFGDELLDAYGNIQRFFPDYFGGIIEAFARCICVNNLSFVENLLEESRRNRFSLDINQMARLSTYWKDKLSVQRKKEAILSQMEMLSEKMPRHTVELFREIYADIFAVLVLNMTLDDYKDIILSFSDMYPPVLNNPVTIRRIFAVFEVVFNSGEQLKEWIKTPECRYAADVKKEAFQQLNNLEESITKDYICQYGRECEQKIRKRIQEINKSPEDKKDLERIRSLYRQDEGFINSLWNFWKDPMT